MDKSLFERYIEAMRARQELNAELRCDYNKFTIGMGSEAQLYIAKSKDVQLNEGMVKKNDQVNGIDAKTAKFIILSFYKIFGRETLDAIEAIDFVKDGNKK